MRVAALRTTSAIALCAALLAAPLTGASAQEHANPSAGSTGAAMSGNPNAGPGNNSSDSAPGATGGTMSANSNAGPGNNSGNGGSGSQTSEPHQVCRRSQLLSSNCVSEGLPVLCRANLPPLAEESVAGRATLTTTHRATSTITATPPLPVQLGGPRLSPPGRREHPQRIGNWSARPGPVGERRLRQQTVA